MNDTIKVVGAIILAILAGGGALFAIKKSKSRKNSSKQSGINQIGDANKVIGADDNSTTTIKK